MRPVDKGRSPYLSIDNYAQALPFLEEQIGCFCSYCEMNINHAPEVEHIFAKSKGGNKTDWDNLLLGCKYCNPRKGTIIGEFPKERWLWPDEDNTFLAFTYEYGLPKINEKYLRSMGDDIYEKAKNMFDDLKLDNIPANPSDKDRRYKSRTDTYFRATEHLKGWLKIKGTEYEDEYKNSICSVASAIGFFSVWMNVFQDELIIRLALISAFKGTASNCFDVNGVTIPRQGGKI